MESYSFPVLWNNSTPFAEAEGIDAGDFETWRFPWTAIAAEK
jgi:hypothetical protein